MNIILTITKNTFRQAIRDKILYGIVIFGFLFMGSAVVLSSLSLGEEVFVARNFGIAGIYLFGLVITVFLGASAIYEEIEKKTVYFTLSKPVSKSQIVLGKFFGLLFSTGLIMFLMALAYLAVVFYIGGGGDYKIFLIILLQLMETGILLGLLILFSTFTTPLAAIIYTILIIYIGHLLSLIQNYAAKSAGPAAKIILTSLYYLMPNLEKFNIRSPVVHNYPISVNELALSLTYAILYIAIAVYAARFVFEKRDL